MFKIGEILAIGAVEDLQQNDGSVVKLDWCSLEGVI